MYNRLAILIGVAAITPGTGYADIIAKVDAPAALSAAGYSTGDVLALPVTLSADADRIAAVEIDIRCSAEAIQIAAVESDDAFPLVLSKEGAALPAQHYAVTRGRAIEDVLRPVAGAEGDQPFATISVEIMTDKPFQAAVEITVRAAVADRAQPATIIRTSDGRESASGAIRIPITSRGATDSAGEPLWDGAPAGLGGVDDPAVSGFLPGTGDTFVTLAMLPTDLAAVEVQPIGGGRPTTTLNADTEYELYFDAGDIPIHEYSAYVVTESPRESLADAYPPASGAWSATGQFLVFDPLAEYGAPGPAHGFRNGLWRYLQIADSQPIDRTGSPARKRQRLHGFIQRKYRMRRQLVRRLDFTICAYKGHFMPYSDTSRHVVDMRTGQTVDVSWQ